LKKSILICVVAVTIASCKNKNNNTQLTVNTDTVKVSHANYMAPAKNDAKQISDTTGTESTDTENTYEDYYIVVADTGANYYTLKDKMMRIGESASMQIDTMGRHYNKAKDLIALADDDEDELYAGDYFPRRYPSKTLSLEYLNFYKPGAKVKTIALVTGIYENKASADSALKLLSDPVAFAFKASVFTGCLH